MISVHEAFVFCNERDNDNLGELQFLCVDFIFQLSHEEAIWHLSQLSNWFIGFLRDVMRESVLLSDSEDEAGNNDRKFRTYALVETEVALL
jgi:hypothetical protein